jgi:hypothetical protein
MHIEHNTEHNRVTDRGQALKNGMRDLLSQFTFTHWVTLNFHQVLTPDAAKQRLKLWTMNVQDRLFRHTRSVEFEQDPFFYFAFPEDTKKLQPHFHLPLRIPADYFDYFERIAGRMWLRIVPSGTSDVQRIVPTDLDHLKVRVYATKQFNRACSHNEFFTSTMLVDPISHLEEAEVH